MTVASLPRIELVTEVHDAGEGGAASCPHCGSLGRYVISFVTEDGEQRAAMRGCFKLFPHSRFVEQTQKLLMKERQAIAAEQAGNERGQKLNQWDDRQLNALHQLNKGHIELTQAMQIFQDAEMDKKNWMRSRGFCR